MTTENSSASAAGSLAVPAPGKAKGSGKALQNLQRFGRSLMLPIAALPAAVLLLRLGQDDLLEFSFMFVAWPLYLVHAVLTGTSVMLVNFLGIHHGFGFSAGAIDYILNFGIAQNPLWLILIGLGYAALYYVTFRFVIRRWNLRTMGREDETDENGSMAKADAS
jgi:phosphotransferase system  glucose/maltose/N-acetylglucosamine-specific IIC component